MTTPATLGFGLGLVFTPDAGGPITMSGIADYTPPAAGMAAVVGYTPMDIKPPAELGAIGKDSLLDAKGKLFYNADLYASLAAVRRSHGTLSQTFNDGQIRSVTGFLTEVAQGQVADSQVQTIDFSIKVDAGSETVVGSYVVNATITLTSGVATLDLTASPWSATGVHIGAISYLAKDTNGAVITVTKSVSNGYAGFGADYSEALDAGVSGQRQSLATAVVVGSTNRDLTFTGTGSTDSVAVSVLVLAV